MSSMDGSAIASPLTTISDCHALRFNFQNSYVQLPERFFAGWTRRRWLPPPVKVNENLARTFGLDPDALASKWC